MTNSKPGAHESEDHTLDYRDEGENKFVGVVERIKEVATPEVSVVTLDPRTSGPLHMVVAAMCYLASLISVGVLTVNDAVSDWSYELSRSVTVQLTGIPLSEAGSDAAEAELKLAIELLHDSPGILDVRPIRREESVEMLEPWLGVGNVDDLLPVPQLIEVQLDSENIPDLEALRLRLAQAVPGAKLDDHTKWNDQILIFADFLRGIAFGILALITVTTMAIIIFATRAGLAARQEVVEVLHFIGARDSFIAQEFQNQFLKLGLRASLFGLVAAVMTVALVFWVGSLMSNEAASGYLLPALELSPVLFLWLLAVPMVASGVIAIAARVTALQAIGRTL